MQLLVEHPAIGEPGQDIRIRKLDEPLVRRVELLRARGDNAFEVMLLGTKPPRPPERATCEQEYDGHREGSLHRAALPPGRQNVEDQVSRR